VQSAINKIANVNIDEVGASATKNFRDCCFHGTLITDGEQYGEGTGTISAQLSGIPLWGGTFFEEFHWGEWSATVNCEAGVILGSDFSASGTIGQRFNECKDESCYYCSLEAGATIACSVQASVTGCVETPWTEEKCATASVTPASVEATFSGSLGCNSSESCDEGCYGDITVGKVEFVASVQCGSFGAEFRHTIYGGD
jgi:hypothetical protein